MRFKTITMNLSIILHLLVEPITYIEKPKASMEASISIRKLTWTVTSSNPVIYPSLYSFLFFGYMLISNRYLWGTVESHVVNSADRCGGRNTTGKMKWTESRNCISIIDLIKGRYVICWVPSIIWKIIVEEILSKSFREFSDTDQFVIVLSLNPITKQFPKISNSHSHRNYCTYPQPTTLSSPPLLQWQIILSLFVAGFNLINSRKKFRHNKGMSNRANINISKLVRILR